MENKHLSRKKDFDIMLSKLNALEASAEGNFQRSLIVILKVLVDNQIHLSDEFEHLKKAIDLLTLQIFKVERKIDS